MRRWLARLNASFFVLGFVLAWQGYKTQQAEGTTGKVVAAYLAAAGCAAAGLAGTRERHRPQV
jgi:hypothetical protein